MEELGTPFVCTVDANGSPVFTLRHDPPKCDDRNLAPADDSLSPEMIAQMVKDSVERSQPNRELSTASRYLLLAATNICQEAFRNFSGFLDHFQSDEARVLGAGRKESHGPDSPCAQRPRRDRGAGRTLRLFGGGAKC